MKFQVPPDQRSIPTSKLPTIADRLLAAIAKLEAWDIRVADLGRLRQAERILRQASAAGEYPSHETRLREIAESIRIAQDFGQIVEAFEADMSERLAKQLQNAMKGTVAAKDAKRTPFQFQSQFWFGAALHRGGLAPRIPSDRYRNPDFVVQPGSLEYGIEVKRPESRRGSFDAISTARDQLEAGNLFGVVVLDLSDVLEDIGLRRFVGSASGQPYEEARAKYRQFAQELVGSIWDSTRRQFVPRYRRVFALWILARGWRWVLDSLESPQLFDMQGMQRLSSAAGNVWFYRSDEFFRMAFSGFRRGGWSVHEVEQESDEPVVRPFWEPILP